ncbi:RNA 3'-terminal phosphate cyclase domain-containing protein [Lineolata rhizophorae]|uniref:RNA 3'-terminal phosphate cyclase domain-containing protein n=1 Tax=Lineolata rhizophorae TaxID=578093 RepID=A0A6A6NQW0_9PEZI|nr:RNA 3'-terminal phosphate cyclase domain-containing protein [Lineolata rhizophorae]
MPDATTITTATPICLDGSTLEGGGQLLRVALALSALTRIPIRLTSIRANRGGLGGVKGQHLAAIAALAEWTGAEVQGAVKGGRELLFWPGRRWEREAKNPYDGFKRRVLDDGHTILEYTIHQNTPGSIALVLQAVLPFLLFTPVSASPSSSSSTDPTATTPIPTFHLTITGGTNVSSSPSTDYLAHVLFPTLSFLFNLPTIRITHVRRGWSTSSSAQLGSATFEFAPLPAGATAPPRERDIVPRGGIVSVTAVGLAPRDAWMVLKDEVERGVRRMRFDGAGRGEGEEEVADAHAQEGWPGEVEFVLEDSGEPKRLYLLLVARTADGSRLGRDSLYGGRARDLSSAVRDMVGGVLEKLGRELASGACLDEHMLDQVVVFRGLARGKARVGGGRDTALSRHARTAMWVVGEIIDVEWDEEGVCEGAGFEVGERNENEKDRNKEKDTSVELPEMESLSLV